MKNPGAAASVIGMVLNFTLFLIKLYVGISSNSLAVYCDAVNNLGDVFACGIALAGALLAVRFSERKAARTGSLFTFVMNIIVAVSGAYFVYAGAERIFYPLPVSYSLKYAVLVLATIAVKMIMGVMYYRFNRRSDSELLKTMILDSVLDCFITLSTAASLFLVPLVNFAADGFFAVAAGAVVTAAAVKNLIDQAKYLIND